MISIVRTLGLVVKVGAANIDFLGCARGMFQQSMRCTKIKGCRVSAQLKNLSVVLQVNDNYKNIKALS